MDNFDFNISHSVINTLHSGYQGKFAALNTLAKLGDHIDTAEHSELKTQLDMIGSWGQALWKGEPLLLKSQKTNMSEQAQKALHLLGVLKTLLNQAADSLGTILAQTGHPDDAAYRELTAAFIWYAYARDNYLKGLLAYCEVVKDEAQAQQYRQVLGSCQNEIRMAHGFINDIAGGIQDRNMLWIRLYDAAVNLPGMFRSQSADIDILLARYFGKITYKAVGIDEKEALEWSQMGVAADVAAYWKAYSINPSEAAQWMLVKFGDPTYVSSWRSRGFNPQQAADWRSQGFNAKKAALNRDMGYSDPSIAKSWSDETEKQRVKEQEEQARQEQARAQQAWTEQGFSGDETAKWQQRGFRDAEQAAQWRNDGFAADQAQSWKNYGFAPMDAAAWYNAGFEKAHEATPYHSADISLEDASQWKEAGFNIRQYANFRDVKEALAYIKLGETPAGAVNWKSINQSPGQVETWKAAGVESFSQAKQWLAEQIDDPQQAAKWIQAGMSVYDVKAWKQGGLSTKDAISWRQAGFTSPQDARAWRDKGYDDPQQAATDRRKSPEFVEAFVTRLMFTTRSEPQNVVIHLGTNTDLLNKSFLEAFTKVAKGIVPNGEKERIYFADVFGWIADCLRRLLNGNPAINIELALGCLFALQDMLKDDLPGPAKIQLQFWIAQAFISRQKGDKKQNVEKALSILVGIDKLVNNVTSPKFWAEVQRSFAWGLYERPAGDRRKNLMMAIKRYEAALTVFTPQKYPTEHNFTKSMKTQAIEALQSIA